MLERFLTATIFDVAVIMTVLVEEICMEDEATPPSISIVVHDRSLDSVAVVRAVEKALDSCFPFGCVSAGIGTNRDEEATASFHVRPEGSDERDETNSARAAIDRVSAHCDLLDALGIANGTKAIAIALHSEWTDALRARFGDTANPATVKRWRTIRRRGGTVQRSAPWTRRLTGPERVVRGLRRHHAINVNAGGGSVRDGYARAMAEVRAVNEGGHRFYGQPDSPLPPFSYETFRQDCLGIRRRQRRR